MTRAARRFGSQGFRRGPGRGAARPLVLAAALLLAGGCRSESAAPDGSPDPRAESTRRMAERLAEVAANADPSRNPYLNDRRARSLARSPLPEGRTEALVQRGRLARELLHAGRTGAALDSLERLLEETRAGDGTAAAPEAIRRTLLELRAVGHLHRALLESCVEARRGDRCLAPPPEGVLHPDTTDARAALRLYRELSVGDPDDLLARWLLNLSAMQADAWPEAVAGERRVPSAAFADPDAGLPRFPDVAADLGIDALGHAGGGVLDDLDGDGDLDVMVSSRGLDDQLRFFRNEGDGTFTERTREAGLEGLVGGLNLVQADYDGDGDLDVLVLRGAWLPEDHPNSLLRNRGDGTFEDATVEVGLDAAHPTQTAAWADYDGDGDLDLFVGNESSEGSHHPSELFRNEGDGTFTNVAAEAGVAVMGFVKGVDWGDVDDDDRPDLYVSRLGEPNLLFRNAGPAGPGDGGAWRFEDVTAEAGVAEPVESFPTWFWDYDDDGDLDLFVSGYRAGRDDVPAEALGRPHGAETPRLYRNRGDGTFEDVTAAAGLDRILYAMGSNYGDLNGDGYPDLYVGTGEPDLRALMPSRAFLSRPGGPAGRTFREVTAPAGLGHLLKGHAVSFGDVDRDGDQDVHAVFGGAYEGDVGRNALYLNPGPDPDAGHAWLTLRLEGTGANRSAVGARVAVTVRTPDGTRVHHDRVTSGGSFGASSLQLEMGLGDARAVESVEIRWPGSGRVERLEGLELGRTYRVREGEGRAVATGERPIPMRATGAAGDPATTSLPGASGGRS